MARQPGIVIFKLEYERVRDKLSFEQKGRLLDALMEFSDTGEEYCGEDPFVAMAFCFFSAAIQRSAEQYERRSKANSENVRRRWEKDNANDTSDTIRMNRTNSVETKQIGTKQNGIKTKRDKFSPPSLGEVTAYCTERQNGIDAAAFIDHYAARGWELRPGIRMRDWKAAVRTWESNQRRWNNGVSGSCSGNTAPGQRSEYLY